MPKTPVQPDDHAGDDTTAPKLATANTGNGAADATTDQARAIAALETECAGLKEKLLRALAEGENTRRRSARDLAQAQKYGHANFARDVIGVVENLTRAIEAIPQSQTKPEASNDNLIIGIKMVAAEMEKVLTDHGLLRINPTGQAFDPNCHQAMLHIATKDTPPGHVMQTTQIGWMLHDRLLRPAMVAVAKAPDDAANTGDPGDSKASSGENAANSADKPAAASSTAGN